MKIYVGNEIIEKVKENHDDVSIHLIAYDYEDIEISSLEQHEEELRKPLEEEIVSLRRFISQLEFCKSYWYNSYDEIRNKYNKNQQVKQERLKVIAELEEWALKEKYSGWTTLDKLKQKLKEMKELKGGSDE